MTSTGGEKSILAILRKHAHPVFAGLSMITAVGFGSGAVKQSVEKSSPVPIEQKAQIESLSQMPECYTDKFQALDDEYVLEAAWKMIQSKSDLHNMQYEIEYWLTNYGDLSEYDRHMLHLDERALILSLNELKKLPKKFGSIRKESLQELRARFENQLMRVRLGHGLLQSVPTSQGYAKWGDASFAVGMAKRGKGAMLLSAKVLHQMYQICVADKKGNVDVPATLAQRNAYLVQVGREIMSDNAPKLNVRRLERPRG